MQKERTARYITNEVIMEFLLWVVLALLISKVILKSVAPYTNRALDDKLKEYWENLKNYF